MVELVAVPAALVTLIGPVLAGLGTVALICVSDTTVKDRDFLPLKATAFVPVKCDPVMVTTVPAGPLVGEKELITGR